MCLGKDTENETFIFNNSIFNNSNEKKKPGITIDNKLTFKSNIIILCRKAEKIMGGFIKAIKSSEWFSEKVDFQFLSKVILITALLYGYFVQEHQIIW